MIGTMTQNFNCDGITTSGSRSGIPSITSWLTFSHFSTSHRLLDGAPLRPDESSWELSFLYRWRGIEASHTPVGQTVTSTCCFPWRLFKLAGKSPALSTLQLHLSLHLLSFQGTICANLAVSTIISFPAVSMIFFPLAAIFIFFFHKPTL